jgi:hypothetical protein
MTLFHRQKIYFTMYYYQNNVNFNKIHIKISSECLQNDESIIFLKAKYINPLNPNNLLVHLLIH